jgi:diguanylate cyclase (GGDEF)-like protein
VTASEGAVAAPVPVTERPLRRLGFSDRIVLIARVATATTFTALYAVGVLRFSDAARPFFLVALALASVTALSTVVATVSLRQRRATVLREMLVLDVATIALLAWTVAPYQDLAYAWALGLCVIYGDGLPAAEAIGFASLLGVAYFAGQIAGPSFVHTLAFTVVLLIKSSFTIVFAWTRAAGTVRQDERERRLKKTQREYHDLNRDLSRRLGELRAISDISEIIHSTLDFEQVGQLVLEILSKVIDLPASTLWVIDQSRNETLFEASFGVRPFVPDDPPEGWSPQAPGPGLEMFACSVVLERNDFSVVLCADGELLENLSSEDRLVLTSVASELVVALENSQLYKLTKRLSITDELTGLHNYRFMQERVQDEIERARRFGRSLSLLMIDVDNFKAFNDTYGHIAGDAALSELAVAFRGALRDVDVLCRYGGEEFTIVLPETDADGAFVAADKVREAVAAHSFMGAEGSRDVRMTVSIGVATFPAHAVEREELLRQADNALYRAKRAGRNRVCAPSGGPIVAHQRHVPGPAAVATPTDCEV